MLPEADFSSFDEQERNDYKIAARAVHEAIDRVEPIIAGFRFHLRAMTRVSLLHSFARLEMRACSFLEITVHADNRSMDIIESNEATGFLASKLQQYGYLSH